MPVQETTVYDRTNVLCQAVKKGGDLEEGVMEGGREGGKKESSKVNEL